MFSNILWHYDFVFTFSSRTGSMTYSPWTRASCTDHFLAFHLLAWFLEDQRVSVPCKVSDVIINYIKPTIYMYKTYFSILYLFDIFCPPPPQKKTKTKKNKEFKWWKNIFTKNSKSCYMCLKSKLKWIFKMTKLASVITMLYLVIKKPGGYITESSSNSI